jgi:hypothetical protein
MVSHITTDPNRREPALCGATPNGRDTHLLPSQVVPTQRSWARAGGRLDLCESCDLLAEMALWPGA